MKLFRPWTVLFILLSVSPFLSASEASLQKQIDDLTKRIVVLEKEVIALSGRENWKDPVYWQKLKKEMKQADVIKLLGKPARIEEQIFTTWYYHGSSKLHSFIWFDEGKVLGWELPDK